MLAPAAAAPACQPSLSASRAKARGGPQAAIRANRSNIAELHARHHDDRVGALGSDRQRLLRHLAGMARVVLVEEELGLPEERLDALLVRTLALFERRVRVLRASKKKRCATDLREAFGVGLG